MDDEMQLSHTKLIPGATEIKRRAWDLGEAKHLFVELLRPSEVGYANRHVMQGFGADHWVPLYLDSQATRA
jgi:hypothetical protein